MKLIVLLFTLASTNSFAKDCVVTISAFEGQTEKKLVQDVDIGGSQSYSVGLSDYLFSVTEDYIYIHKGEEAEFEQATVASTKGDNLNIQTDVFDTMAGEMKWVSVSCTE